MADFLTPAERSHRMSLIRSKDTKCELLMASILRQEKIRYRRHIKTLPGTPDFGLARRRIALFVDGDFFHGRRFEEIWHKLKPYWLKKIARNMERDREVDARLRAMGVMVVRVWESDLRLCRRAEAIDRIKDALVAVQGSVR